MCHHLRGTPASLRALSLSLTFLRTISFPKATFTSRSCAQYYINYHCAYVNNRALLELNIFEDNLLPEGDVHLQVLRTGHIQIHTAHAPTTEPGAWTSTARTS